ncbi:hypothetical protein [Fodinibius sediminis]|uniref:MetA-pathway of phenol degradation n=1 Tax=Fodinibius sediminis TaxID=1214077 RepID=A0A521E616_9BACT|nr:hypothetical protein [Fodinibius sediminis]SMO78620.1 hypothetical protein SAMN06265218_11334 [Fodinibius sediminis]
MDLLHSKRGWFILMMSAGFMLTAGRSRAQDLSYSGSLQFSTGSYFFDESTASFSFSNGFGIAGENLSVSFSVPFIVQNSPWISYGGAGYIPTGGPEHKVVRDSSGRGPGPGGNGGKDGDGSGGGGGKHIMNATGSDIGYQAESGTDVVLPDTSSYTQSSFGDPTLYANLKLYSSLSGATAIRLNSALKFPLADPSSGFGTGEWDYGIGVSASRSISSYYFMANIMKWWFGDLPDLELQNPLTYSFGIGRSLGGGSWLINGTFTGYTEVIDTYDPPRNLNLGIGYFASQHVSLNSTLSWGLSESSSDFSMGLGWNIRF